MRTALAPVSGDVSVSPSAADGTVDSREPWGASRASVAHCRRTVALLLVEPAGQFGQINQGWVDQAAPVGGRPCVQHGQHRHGRLRWPGRGDREIGDGDEPVSQRCADGLVKQTGSAYSRRALDEAETAFSGRTRPHCVEDLTQFTVPAAHPVLGDGSGGGQDGSIGFQLITASQLSGCRSQMRDHVISPVQAPRQILGTCQNRLEASAGSSRLHAIRLGVVRQQSGRRTRGRELPRQVVECTDCGSDE